MNKSIVKIKDMLSARKELVNVLWYSMLRDASMILYGYALDYDENCDYIPTDRSAVTVPPSNLSMTELEDYVNAVFQ